MSTFDRLNTPGTDSRPGYLDAGDFELTITSLRYKPSTNPKKRGHDVFAAEHVVATSTNPAIAVGSTRAWIVTVPPANPADPQAGAREIGDIKCYMLAALGVDPSNAAAVAAFEQAIAAKGGKVSDVLTQITGEGNPLAGKRVAVGCTVKATQTGGKFTIHNWRPAAVQVGGAQ